MRAVVQRVSRGRVTVEGRTTGQIGNGVVVLVGVGRNDSPESARYLADKIAHLRIFEDAEGKMNRSLIDTGSAALVISQFTLYGDVRRGRRPAFDQAAAPDAAIRLYQTLIESLRASGVCVETGVFQADMTVELANEGPVTILLDSEKLF